MANLGDRHNRATRVGDAISVQWQLNGGTLSLVVNLSDKVTRCPLVSPTTADLGRRAGGYAGALGGALGLEEADASDHPARDLPSAAFRTLSASMTRQRSFPISRRWALATFTLRRF